MQEYARQYHELIAPHLEPRNPGIPFISSVTNKDLAHGGELGAAYWVDNLVSPVKFAQALAGTIRASTESKVFLEVGPHSALAGPIRQILKAESSKDDYVSVLTRGKDSNEEVLRAVGQLYLLNHPVDLERVVGGGKLLTDLPLYPWHYEEPIWKESRLAREYRLREFLHHELLGARIAESTSFNPAWRNVLRLEDATWIKDHEIEGDVIVPGVSYLCMAGEAVRQMTGESDFTCEKVHLRNALVLTGDDEKEVITQLNLVDSSSPNSADGVWYDFSISSYGNGSWTKHALGRVRGGGSEAHQKTDPGMAEAASKHYARECSSKAWYRRFRSLGLEYGARFTPLHKITADPLSDRLAASVKIGLRPGEDKYYSIFPGSLDGIPQALFSASSRGLTRNFNRLAVIQSIDEFYMRPPSPETEELRLQCEITQKKPNSMAGDVVAVSAQDGGQVVVRSRGWQLSYIAEAIDGGDESSHAHGAAELEWKEDIDFVNAASFIRQTGIKSEGREPQPLDRLSLLCYAEIQDRLRGAAPPTREFLNHFRKWIDDRIEEVLSKGFTWFGVPDAVDLLALDSEQRNRMIEDMYRELADSPAYGPATALYRVARNCRGIFDGSTSELEVLLANGALQKVYDFLLEYADLSGFLSLMAHKRPSLRVLEIGAGTGGATSTVLPNLMSAQGEAMYLSYTYTDISAGFFGDAKERFKDYTGIEFAVLDISKDPLEQGFPAEGFDLVIAYNVLHATESLHRTLSHVRKLIHPEGRLLLQELAPRTMWAGVFGVLAGWWYGHGDGRTEAPYVEIDRWTEELANAGFDNVTSMHDGYMNNNIVSQPRTAVKSTKRVTVVRHRSQPVPESIIASLTAAGYQVDQTTLQDSPTELRPGQDIISVLDMASPFFVPLDADKLVLLQRFLGAAKEASCGILWLTGLCQVGQVNNPDFAPVLGAARVWRNDMQLEMATLELEDFATAASIVPSVLGRFEQRVAGEDMEPEHEWAYVGGSTLISRYSYIKVHQKLKSHLPPDLVVRKVAQRKPGVMNSNSLLWKALKPQPLQTGQVRVTVKAVGVSSRVSGFFFSYSHLLFRSNYAWLDYVRRGHLFSD